MADSNTLDEVMGAIMAGLASARKAADQHSAQLARQYRQDEVLRLLPVPHLRLQDVEVRLPVAVAKVETHLVPLGRLPDELAARSTRRLQTLARRAGIEIDDKRLATFQRELQDELESSPSPDLTATPSGVPAVAERAMAGANEASAIAQELATFVESSKREEIATHEMEVLVEAAALKAAEAPMMTLSFRVAESGGYEWQEGVSQAADGKVDRKWRLTPE